MNPSIHRCPSPEIVSFRDLARRSSNCGLLIVAGGFERRALEILRRVWSPTMPLLILRYESDIGANQKAFSEANRLTSGGAREVPLNPYRPRDFGHDLSERLRHMLPDPSQEIWLDISGISRWAILETLNQLRRAYPFYALRILYTAAAKYFPTKAEYLGSNVRKEPERLQVSLPSSLTQEMAENVVLESFSGASLKDHSSCLILLAGYEKHRSLGAIEQINPNKLVLAYGLPGDESLAWRLEMSKDLHKALVSQRSTAEEVISTLVIAETVELIERYYHFMYDEYNLAIAPVCSKMQAIGVFLAWERYRDLQLVFPLPVRYLPERYSKGVGRSYEVLLPPPPGLVVPESSLDVSAPGEDFGKNGNNKLER